MYVIEYNPYEDKETSWCPLNDGLGGPEIIFTDLKKAKSYLYELESNKRKGDRFRICSKKVTYTPIPID